MKDRRAGALLTNKPPVVGFWQELKALSGLFPYLWPRDSWELRLRVLVSVALLVAAKAINVGVPMLYKRAVDALSPGHPDLITVPIALIIGYGLARLPSNLLLATRMEPPTQANAKN